MGNAQTTISETGETAGNLTSQAGDHAGNWYSQMVNWISITPLIAWVVFGFVILVVISVIFFFYIKSRNCNSKVNRLEKELRTCETQRNGYRTQSDKFTHKAILQNLTKASSQDEYATPMNSNGQNHPSVVETSTTGSESVGNYGNYAGTGEPSTFKNAVDRATREDEGEWVGQKEEGEGLRKKEDEDFGNDLRDRDVAIPPPPPPPSTDRSPFSEALPPPVSSRAFPGLPIKPKDALAQFGEQQREGEQDPSSRNSDWTSLSTSDE